MPKDVRERFGTGSWDLYFVKFYRENPEQSRNFEANFGTYKPVTQIVSNYNTEWYNFG